MNIDGFEIHEEPGGVHVWVGQFYGGKHPTREAALASARGYLDRLTGCFMANLPLVPKEIYDSARKA